MIYLLSFIQFCFGIIFFILPPKAALAIMRLKAWSVYQIARCTPLKRIVAGNIHMVLPDSPAGVIADKLLRNASQSIFEVICIPFFRPPHYASVFRWDGIEKLSHALKDNHGVILLTLHFGNYEIIPSALGNAGFKVTSVLKATEDPLFKFLDKPRRAGGVKIINVLEENMYAEAVKALSRNEMVGTMADTGALESRHEFIEFLGKKLPVATGWLTLAQRAGCPVIPCLARREGNTNRIIFMDPIIVARHNREETISTVSRLFEDFIKANPDHWLMLLNTYETKRMVEGK
jgi:KDO2-lipid IV(A) lauroyltransferase